MVESIESFPEARAQLHRLVSSLRVVLADKLQAALLHGSLAMSGFEPSRSDLDVLLILSQHPGDAALEQLARLILEISGTPHPLELSAVLESDLNTWRHPCPHVFHFGEAHRSDFEQGRWTPQQPTDPDLAMHLTVARHRGVDLVGRWAPENLPEIPESDFLAAVRDDFRWSASQQVDLTDYRLANACRTLAYLEQRLVLSKTEGLSWCRDRAIEPADALKSIDQRLNIPGPEPSTWPPSSATLAPLEAGTSRRVAQLVRALP